MAGDDDPITGGPSAAAAARKTFWRSASWSASRTEQSNPSSSSRRFQPPPLTPRSQNSKARSCLPPLQPLSIARRSVDEWPKAGSDDVGEWPQPPTPGGNRSDLKLKLDLSTLRSQGNKNQIALFDKECSKVADHIYLGGDSVARNREILRQNGITHVLNCVGFVCPEYFKSDLVYKTLWLQDRPSEDITSILYDVFDYFEDVRELGGRVFVHCCQGVSRSTSLVIAYLMWRKGQSFDDAFQFVKAARGIANPNMGFACQLLQCQKRVHAIPLSPNSVLRMYRMAPHSPYDPLHLVPKMLNDPEPEALDSRGAFIVHGVSLIYVWVGKNCDPVMEKDAKAAACQVVRYESVPGPIVTIDEGEEPLEFWEAFSSLDKVEKDQLQSGTNGGVGKKKVDSYDVDFELFYKAITGGVVPPFPSSGPGQEQETCLPARESNWSVLRRKFISGTIYKVFSDSAMVRDGDPRGYQVQLLSAESSTSPPYLSPSSISSNSSVSSKCCSDSPSISPSTCSSPSLTPSPASSNLPDSSVSSSKHSLQISGTFEASKPCLQTVCSPSRGLARSIAERRGSFSLKLPLNKDTSLLFNAAINASSAGFESTQEVIDSSNGTNNTSRDGSDNISCTTEVPDIKCISHCARDNSDDHADVNNHNHSQDGQLIRNSKELVDSNLGSSNHAQLLVYRWPDLQKLTKFSREDLDSKAGLFFLTPSTGRGSQLGRMLYLWIGSRVEEANGHSHLKSFQKDGVTEIDWTRVGCDFLAQIGLPKDLPIKVVKDQEPEEFLELFNSARFPNK